MHISIWEKIIRIQETQKLAKENADRPTNYAHLIQRRMAECEIGVGEKNNTLFSIQG